MHGTKDDLNHHQQYSAQTQGLQVVQTTQAIANYCGRAERHGKDWKANCPICSRHSLSITYGRKVSILIKCFHCEACGINDGWTEQRAYLVGAGLLDPTEHEVQRDHVKYEKQCAERRAEVLRIWNNIDRGTIKPITHDRDCWAGNYLRARELESFIGHPALRCTDIQLMARVWHVRYRISAIQWTWLSENGADRDRARDPGRTTFGMLQGGAVWFGAPVPDEFFVVAEGVETCLSAMLLLNLKCGAAVLGPNLKGLVLPSNARLIHIAADNDETGRGASACAAKLWRKNGLYVRISYPRIEGHDFNDVLMGSNQ